MQQHSFKDKVSKVISKRVVLSIIFSAILPGLGQYYNAQFKKASIFIALVILSFALQKIFIYTENSYLFYFSYYILDSFIAVIALIDAIRHRYSVEVRNIKILYLFLIPISVYAIVVVKRTAKMGR